MIPFVATIGFFDGVHRGHRYLIRQVQQAAAERGYRSAVVTFPVAPQKVLHPELLFPLLTTAQEKLRLLMQTGLDDCFVLDFTPRLAALSAREFMTMLRDHYHVRVLVIGYDHRFGHRRSEGFEDYVRYARELQMEVLPAGMLNLQTATRSERVKAIGSSDIRRLLSEGNVGQAAAGLGYFYFLEGTVVGGYRIGRTIGYPTANIRVDCPDKLVPASGVYAVRVRLKDTSYGGMLYIGNRPTLNNGPERSIEVNIFHFRETIYDQPIRITFVQYIRADRRFESMEALAPQLKEDEQKVKEVLETSDLPSLD
ncbi:MAG: riboflavin biosynthesis protein RibF [Prevotellaceae bacterium]|jgi:riboflavin kinase/FMN adenylyltransferase|nr:riboflavin biosynthesis protein RibF [Prevotellaceae bacterium]